MKVSFKAKKNSLDIKNSFFANYILFAAYGTPAAIRTLISIQGYLFAAVVGGGGGPAAFTLSARPKTPACKHIRRRFFIHRIFF